MPGSTMSEQLTLITIYITFALGYIQSRKDNLGAVKRAYIEKTILEMIDLYDFPIAFKMAYYNAILNTSQFTAFWLSLQMQHGLLDHQIMRYGIDPSLVHLDLSAPGDDSSTSSLSRSSSPATSSSSSNAGAGANADTSISAAAPASSSSGSSSSGDDDSGADTSTSPPAKKGGKKQSSPGPMAKKAGVKKQPKGILKK
ncbi:MAG: hypothetical protein L6R41_001688 [Letrouitia leprolyta]|nr:MAG: hypothetical protein L6R41_001688 [Letrouitia leprolyta]